MPYSKKYNLCFIHIPKTAGTTIEKTLDMLSEDSLFSEKKYPGKLTTAQHFTLSEIEGVMGSNIDKYDIFTVVRNPYDRIVSEFNHIQHNDWATDYKKLNFDNFVEKALHTPVEDRIRIFDAHIEPQHTFLNSNTNRNINIFKYENLSECFEWLKQKTNTLLHFGHERKSVRKNYKEYFNNQNTIDLVQSFYLSDFETFNYTK